MPTVEERLAALEAKLAQLTDTTPTTYYTHQYSGEEIDNAVSRALPNGAIDQAVGTFVRPNLLDNWYFGNPVDQRGGYVVYAGANLYTDASCTTVAGQVAGGPYAARAISAICVSFTSNATYYCKIGDTGVVRGYTDTGYTVDRWLTDIDNGGAVLVGSNGITLSAASMYWGERLTNIAVLSGRTMTASVLMSDGSIFHGTVVISWGLNVPQSFFNNGFISVYVNKIDNDLAQFEIATNTANVALIAAKLELGPTQTLAHREGDKWVINEVPEYGNQLRRCQRYAIDLHGPTNYGVLGSGVARRTDRASIFCPLPVSMRVTPVATFGGSLTLASDADAGRGYVVTAVNVDHINSNGITLNVDTAGLTISTVYQLWRQGDASAHILLSADL